MTTTQMDPTTRIEALIALTEELTSIFSRENVALASRRPVEIFPLQADKARLAAAYAQTIRAIAADRTLMLGASEGLMQHLKTITLDFEARAGEQRALLDGARMAAEGVLRAVAAEAGAAKASASYRGPLAAPDTAPLPLAINEDA